MFKQIILPLLAVVAFVVVIGLFVQKSSSLRFAGFGVPQPTTGPLKTISIGKSKIQVQLADTPEKRVRGLSGTAKLEAGEGMLFTFDSKGTTSTFWMKDMLIPLDIVWISGGEVVKIDKNVPVPAANTPDVKLKTYSAGTPIDYVLEVNSGFCDQNDIKVGNTVDLSRI